MVACEPGQGRNAAAISIVIMCLGEPPRLTRNLFGRRLITPLKWIGSGFMERFLAILCRVDEVNGRERPGTRANRHIIRDLLPGCGQAISPPNT